MNVEELLAYINDKKDGLAGKLAEYTTKQRRYKLAKSRGETSGNPVSYLVDFWPGYIDAVLSYEAAMIHSRGKFPDYLFRVLQPLQDKIELDYLRATYQAITKDVFLEFSNTAKKAIQNGNIEFTIKEGDEDGNDLKKYLYNDINDFNSIVQWLGAMLDQKLIDSMGIFAVWPEYDIDEEGTIIGETNPQPLVYNCDKIVWKKDGEFLVMTSKTTNDGGVILRFFGKEYIAQFNQVGKNQEFQFETFRYFEHSIGYAPAQELKGIAVIEDEHVKYDSVFNMAVPQLNLAVIDSVTLLAIKKKVGFPTRVVAREKCQFQEGPSMCEGGKISISNGSEMKTHDCPQCRGTGFIGVFGPMSELIINVERGIDQEKTGITAANALQYVGPSTEIPKFLREEVEHSINRAKEVLHLKSEPRGSGDISATEKNRDKENTEAFIKPISEQLWDIAAMVIECIGIMKYGESYESMKPVVIPAQSFDLLGPEDYIAEMSEAKKSGAPEVVIQNIVYKYMQVLHHDNTISMRVFQLIEKSDRVITMSNNEVAIAQSRGTVAPWEAVMHQSSTYILHRIIMETPNFWDMEETAQLALIEEKAKSLVPVAATEELPPPVEP